MANTKTSAESPASTFDGTELVRIVQGGTMAKATTAQFASFGYQPPITTKGDLIVYGTSGGTRFPVGTDGYVLSCNSTVPNGIQYIPPGVSGSNLANPGNGTGVDLVGGAGRTVNSIAALRALLISGVGKAFVLGYYAPGDGGGGQYYYDSTDTSNSDNGGTIIVAFDGGRWKLVFNGIVNPDMFGAKGVAFGSTPSFDSSSALTAMFATKLSWTAPTKRYLVSQQQFPQSSGTSYAEFVAPAGYTGTVIVAGCGMPLFVICNPNYGTRWLILGLDVYSTDVRPNPYNSALATTGIYVGPTAAYIGNTPCPNVTLIGAKATRFSFGVHIASFNIDFYSSQIYQNDHNVLIYSTDLSNNQVNDIRLTNCALDSAASSVGQPYALRIGTIGNATYAPSIGMGYRISIHGCNFDGAPVYVDNVIGFDFRSYCEQPTGYTYHGGAIVLGSAGTNTLQDVNISQSTFILFDYAVVEKNTVLGLVVGPNNCSSVKYRELLAVGCEAQGFLYKRGTNIGSFNSNGDPVGTNFSSGISPSQIDFSGISIDSDFLNSGSQLAPKTTSTTSWYARGITNDGNQLASSVGRSRSGSAVQSNISGNQSGQLFTFSTQSQASLFNGGDVLTGTGSGSALYIFSVDYVAGTAILNTSYTGPTTISHSTGYFVGYNIIGNGSPQGFVTANPGTKYTDITSSGSIRWFKSTGIGTNTGWVSP